MTSPVRQVQQLTAEVPADVMHKLFRDFCLAKYRYSPEAYASPEAREERIDYDASSYCESDSDAVLRALVGAAFNAGRESAFDGCQVEWGFRCDGHVFGPYRREDYARAEHARQLGMGRTQDLMTRRATAWEVADV